MPDKNNNAGTRGASDRDGVAQMAGRNDDDQMMAARVEAEGAGRGGLSQSELDELVADGTIAGGMIPKVDSCTHAVRNGVRNAHILDGRIAHVLLLEIFTPEGVGTMITEEPVP